MWTYIDDCAILRKLLPRISLNHSLHGISLSTTMSLHSQVISLRKHLILLNKVEPRKILLIRKIHSSLRRLLTRRPLLHRRDDMSHRQPQVVAHEANPAPQGRILANEPRRAGVRHEALFGLYEDAVGDGVADEAAEIKD